MLYSMKNHWIKVKFSDVQSLDICLEKSHKTKQKPNENTVGRKHSILPDGFIRVM